MPHPKIPRTRVPCPVDRIVTGRDGRVRCASIEVSTRIRVGDTVVSLGNRGIVRSPKRWAGIHVLDLFEAYQDSSSYRRSRKQCDDAEGPLRYQTFANPQAALKALRSANPVFERALGRLRGPMDEAFERWVRGGRRGPRPTYKNTLGIEGVPGELDWSRMFTDYAKRRGYRKAYSWTEAFYAITPKSRRWDDFLPRLEEMVNAMNALASSDPYMPTITELTIPGRAGAAMAKRAKALEYCERIPTIEEVLAPYKQQRSRSSRSRDDLSDIPF